MSLYPQFVQMSNSKWYRNPIIYGQNNFGNNWFICWDESDPVELVLEYRIKYMEKPGRKLQIITDCLQGAGIKAKVFSCRFGGKRLFPHDNWGKFRTTLSVFIKLLENIDLKNHMFKADEFFNEKPELTGDYWTVK